MRKTLKKKCELEGSQQVESLLRLQLQKQEKRRLHGPLSSRQEIYILPHTDLFFPQRRNLQFHFAEIAQAIV